jgi:translation initiation factor 2 beta subunit (eIF-2beta)/eIF-5
MEDEFEKLLISLKQSKRPKDSIKHTHHQDPKSEYKIILKRLYSQLYKNNPELVNRTQVFLVPPKVEKINNKICVTNFGDICNMIHRSPDYVSLFFETELITDVCYNNNKLFIKGLFKQTYIQNILENFIKKYVECKSCKLLTTTIQKRDRSLFLCCSSCLSERSIQQITHGYKHV